MNAWATVVAAAIGGAIAYFVARQSSRQQTHQHRDRLAHERELAETTGQQDRLERAYLQLLDVLNMMQRTIEQDGPDKPPPDYEAENDRIAAVWPALDAFGSPMVRDMFNAWRAARLNMRLTIDNTRGRGPLARAEIESIRQDRQTALELATAIRDRVALELRSPTDRAPRIRGKEYPQPRT